MPTSAGPRPSPTPRERLLGAATRVFAERGFHATTMRDLARASGMSLAGMYHYVRSKDELLLRIQERCFERVMREACVALDGVDDPVERLRVFVRHHVTFFAGHMPEMKILSHEAGSLTGGAARTLRAKKSAYAALLEEIVGDVQPEATTAERSVTAYAIFGMMNWIYTWYRPTGPIAPDDLAARLADLALRGAVATEPARTA